MRVETTHRFSIPLKQGYDYLMDPNHFVHWQSGMISLLDPETASWSKPGDGFDFAYRMLGRRIEGHSTLDELRDYEFVRYTATVPGLGSKVESWYYEPIDDDSFEVTIIQEGPEQTSFFGKLIDRTLLPRILERDLLRALDNLDDIFSMGVPD